MDTTGWDDPPSSTYLELSSVLGTPAHTVTALPDDRGFPGIVSDRMRTEDVDWHVDISSSVFINGVCVPRVVLTFAGSDADDVPEPSKPTIISTGYCNPRTVGAPWQTRGSTVSRSDKLTAVNVLPAPTEAFRNRVAGARHEPGRPHTKPSQESSSPWTLVG